MGVNNRYKGTCSSNAALVNKYVGTAYDHVKTVSDNIEDVKTVADALGDNFPDEGLDTLVNNIDDIVTNAENISDINTVAGIKDEVVTVAGIEQEIIDVPSYTAQAIDAANAAEQDADRAETEADRAKEQADLAANIADPYKGLWPDVGGSANKGDVYQTQVGGIGTGQYFTALQNTTVDPVNDDINWRDVDTFSSGPVKYPSYFGCVPTSIDPLFDNTTAMTMALDSGYLIEGGCKEYYCASKVQTTTSGLISARNIKILSGVSALSGDAVDLSSSEDLRLNSFRVSGFWDGSDAIPYADAINNVGFKYKKSDSGIARLSDIYVKDWNGLSQQVDSVATIFADHVISSNTAYGNRYTNIQSGFINNVKVRDTRRIGFTCQSTTNTTDYDDLQLSNVSVTSILPGVGSGQDLHGIGVEIHNFVDEALATNVRANLCHSVGVSLSGCEYGRVINLHIKNTGYTSESDGVALRSYAALELVDSDGAYVEGVIRDSWQTHIRFDKSHYARVKIIGEQNNDIIDSSNARFIRYQGTADDLNNSAWGCVVENSEFRNNTESLIPLTNFGLYSTFGLRKHQINNTKVYNTLVDKVGNLKTDGLTIESDGKFDKASGGVVDSLLDLVDVGANPYVENIEYIGLDSSLPPTAFCRISSSAMAGLVLLNCRARNVANILTAASGTLAETVVENCLLDNVQSLYTGTISSAYRNQGSSNIQINGSTIPQFPTIRHGNSVSGVSGNPGDIMIKRGTGGAGSSPAWQLNNDGVTWSQFADLQ